MKDRHLKESFIELRATGMSFDKIAREIDVSKQTLINWSKDLQLELANAKAIVRDAYWKRLELHEQGRLELYGDILQGLKNEMKNRDLSEIPTEKLIELILKITKSVSASESALILKQSEIVSPFELPWESPKERAWEA